MKFNFLLPQLIILILLANFISCGTQESNVLDINPSPPEVAKTQSEISENTQSYDKVQPEKKAINSIDNTKLEKSDEEIASDLENSMIILEFGNDSDNSIRANYRVTEQLARLSYPIDAVGYTEDVFGSIYIDATGQPTPESLLTIDLSNLKSDESRRDNYLRGNALETDKFPQAFFLVNELKNLDMSDLTNLNSNDIEFQMAGDLTIHGVTKSKTWNVVAKSELGSIKGNASISFPFSDFDIDIPKLFFIISVEDKITLELDFDVKVILNPSLDIDTFAPTITPEFPTQSYEGY
ncbi:MAG: YceI family protein [Dehalococcoidia bacterium]|nr:YceI family protein [Dehalococcoidia bacterium]|tara:strand:- start:1149 stop:2033 length:885 start_codon:yes stop_codon:yes gene_type:complete